MLWSPYPRSIPKSLIAKKKCELNLKKDVEMANTVDIRQTKVIPDTLAECYSSLTKVSNELWQINTREKELKAFSKLLEDHIREDLETLEIRLLRNSQTTK